jgi:signal transduction histidine kinase
VIDFSIVPLATRNTVFDVGFVIYIVAKQLPRREAWLALAGSLAVWTVSVAVFLPGALPDMPFKPTAWQTVVNYGLVGDLVIGAAWTIGYAVRQRQAYTEALRREAERQAEARADERVVAERLRIARELHDVVAHSMSLIAVQAGVAHYVGAERPEAATQALGSIERTSREALREMRRLLGVLRGSSGEREDPELAPAPRLADLARLAEATTAAGLEVRLRCDAPGELPAGLELAAYRIVQEALTNVIKHAEARQVDVGVRYEGGVLRVEVQDDGRGGPPLTSRGHGLLGMNERVAFYGGEFAAGPAPGGGFRVAAALPLSEEATAA